MKQAGLEYAEQHDLSDSGLQVMSGVPSQDPHGVSYGSSTRYTPFPTTQNSDAQYLEADAVWCPPSDQSFGFTVNSLGGATC